MFILSLLFIIIIIIIIILPFSRPVLVSCVHFAFCISLGMRATC